ncbi:MAG: glycosyl transferase group 1 [Fibrobacteria bacterium]|jgi:glycosyltransferase involved in cell wall biosynthesis|nr:glycosyl transferase group 1 [Fibrobacteria bacterium]
MKVLHVISGLTSGGAERMLYKLAVEMRRDGFASEVACLGPRGGAGSLLESAGIPVHYLGLKKNLLFFFGIRKLAALVKGSSPDIIQGWMYQGNLAAAWALRLSGASSRLFWSVHQSLYSLRYETWSNALMIRLSDRLSSLPECTVFVSRAARAQHIARGYPPERTRSIPIGFDTTVFRPYAPEEKRRARRRLGLPERLPLVGLVARHDPKKDQASFIEAAARVAKRFPDARFLLLGRNMEGLRHPLRVLARERGVEEAILFRGETAEVQVWTAVLDIAVSSSYTEGFPNVVGEAMACAVPCVVTDVGDSARLLGDAGLVVPPRDAAALAEALARLLASGAAERSALGAAGRARIEENFTIEKIGREYAGLYRGGR